MYGDFKNKQLQNGQEYIFFVLAVLEMSENVSLSSIQTLPLSHFSLTNASQDLQVAQWFQFTTSLWEARVFLWSLMLLSVVARL